MRKTILKRSTKPLKRSSIKHKVKRYPISQTEIDIVIERSGGVCENCGTTRSCQIAHIVPRGMGGVQSKNAHIINEHRNMTYLCKFDHDVIDRQVDYPLLRGAILSTIKNKIGWYEWQKEFNVPVKDENNGKV